jgi:hypothetical protein
LSRATATTTAGAAVALTGVLLGSVLLGAWGGDDTAPLRPVSDSASAQLPLRQPTVAVTITARPSPVARRAATVARAPSATARDADLAAWLATAGLPDPGSLDNGYVPWVPTTPLLDATTDPVSDPGAEPTDPTVPTPDPTAGTTVPPTPSGPTADFTISSFNVLGSSHTRGGARGKQSGVTRMSGAVDLLAQHDVDVVGFQELQSDQLRELQRLSPGYDVYPGTRLTSREAENSVAWRSSVWELVRPETFSVPYFDGNRRRMPVVLLRHRATGLTAYFANVHNPADTRRYHGQQRWRDQATAVEVALMNRLTATGIPVFLTGDMNERDSYFCALTSGTSMVAARGGSNGTGGCDARNPRAVDWVFGSAGVRFSSYDEDRSPLVDRTTDHPVVSTRASIDAGTFPASATR